MAVLLIGLYFTNRSSQIGNSTPVDQMPTSDDRVVDISYKDWTLDNSLYGYGVITTESEFQTTIWDNLVYRREDGHLADKPSPVEVDWENEAVVWFVAEYDDLMEVTNLQILDNTVVISLKLDELLSTIEYVSTPEIRRL